MESSQSKAWWVAQGMDDARPLKAFPGDQHIPLAELMQVWNQREDSSMVFATPGEYAAALAQQDLPLWDGVIDQVDVAYNSGWHGALYMAAGGARVVDDVSIMLSPEHYLRYSLPYVRECMAPFGGGWVHSCGNISHQLDAYLEELVISNPCQTVQSC